MGQVGFTEFLLLSLLVARIAVPIYNVNRARKLNRSKFGWGLFGFLLPFVALICIQIVKPFKIQE